MTNFRFWDFDTVRDRLNELQQRIDDEAANLSDFRRDEAIYLVLSDDEQAEYSCLWALSTHLLAEQERRRKMRELFGAN